MAQQKPAQEIPEEVKLIESYVDGRIAEIQGKEKISPWNKAKLMAFQEVKDVINPPEVVETPAVTETPATEAPTAVAETTVELDADAAAG